MVGHTGGSQRYPVSSSVTNRKPKYSKETVEAAKKAGEPLKDAIEREIREREVLLRERDPELYDEIMKDNKKAWEVNSKMTSEDKYTQGMLPYRNFESEINCIDALKK